MEELVALASTDVTTSAMQQTEDEASGQAWANGPLVAFVRALALLHDKNGDTYAKTTAPVR